MDRIKSIAKKRLIIEAKVNDKAANFLIDTGASVAIMDSNQKKKYDLKEGRKFGSTIVGAGGEMRNVRHCETFAYFEGRAIPQFLLADISSVVESIKKETGVEILGIISLPQMSIIGMNIDVNSQELWLE